MKNTLMEKAVKQRSHEHTLVLSLADDDPTMGIIPGAFENQPAIVESITRLGALSVSHPEQRIL